MRKTDAIIDKSETVVTRLSVNVMTSHNCLRMSYGAVF